MFEYLFGKYLMNSGRLTQEKLAELIDWSKAEEALSDSTEAFIDNSQEVERINTLILKKLSELTAEYDPVANVAAKTVIPEHQPNLLFFKGLMRKNIIPKEAMGDELIAFTKYYFLEKEGFSKKFSDDAESVFASFVNSHDYFANQYMTILLKYIMRFVNAKIDFSPSSGVFSHFAERLAIQKVVAGDTRYFIGIGGEKITLQKLNDLLKPNFTAGGHGNNPRYDNLLTFLNCASCIFQSVIEKEKEIQLVDSPFIYKFSTVSANESCSLLPVSVGEFKLDLLIGFGYRPNFAKISHNI